jgi:hypothetical protein
MIIGLTGYAGSGKTTAAKHLAEAHGFLQVKFAGPLKAMVRCLGLGDAEIEGNLKESPSAILGGRTPRHAMQTLGSEWGRDLIHPNLWVNAAMAVVDDVLDHGGRVVIDDLRFQNEAEAIKSRGGIIIRIERPGVGPVNGHESESNPIPHDWAIQNTVGVNHLRLSINHILIKESAL